MLKDLFKMNIFHDTDEGVGAGGKDTPNTEGSQEETPEGAGQPEIVIGDEKFDRNDPDLVDKLVKKSTNLQSGLTRKAQELSELKKTQVKPQIKPEIKKEAKKETEKPTLADERINRMYERTINADVENFIKDETNRLSAKYGKNFDIVKDEFVKEANGLKKFDLTAKEQILARGNLDVLVNSVLAKSLAVKGSNTTSPKTDIKSYQEQENLPPKPEGQGATNIPSEIDMEQTLKGDVKFSKAKELAKKARAIRSGEGVRLIWL